MRNACSKLLLSVLDGCTPQPVIIFNQVPNSPWVACVSLPRDKDLACIAFGVTKTRKPPHLDKVVTKGEVQDAWYLHDPHDVQY